MYSKYMDSMLIELKIENFGIIENQRIRLQKKLNIISGETGSGKSLVMNALDVVLGARAAPGLVRNGAHRAIVEAVFELDNLASDSLAKLAEPLQEALSQNHSYVEFRREITAEGRSRMFCNGEIVTLTSIRPLVMRLIETHGQHEHQRILDMDTHLEFLDTFAETQNLCQSVGELYQRFSVIRNRLRNVNLESEAREQRREYLHFVLDEIERFVPREGEFAELEHEKALIQNSGRLFQDLCTAYSLIREEEPAILDHLASLTQLLEPHCDLLPQAQEHLGQIQEANYLLEAAADFLREQKSRLQFSPERLEDVNERLAGYQHLHKKYGGSTQAVLHKQQKYLQELGSIEMSSEQMQELEEELANVSESLLKKAEELSRLRRAAIPSLERKLANELAQLGMPGAALQVCVKREVDLEEANVKTYNGLNNLNGYNNESNGKMVMDSEESCLALQNSKNQNGMINSGVNARSKYVLHEKGLDRVEFLLLSNPGEAPRPLRKIASGGELSRISLAFRSIFCEVHPVSTIIFDEVDAGVGGEVAHTIGKRLKALSEHSQVLVVTHLPQIARLADQHFSVSKEYADGRVYSRLQRLEERERVRELARMLGGNTPGQAVLEHAQELLLQQC